MTEPDACLEQAASANLYRQQRSTFRMPVNCWREHQVTVTHSLGRANSSVENVFFPHRLVPSDTGDSVNFLHRHIQLKSSSLNFINYGADIEVVVRDLDRQMYIMVIPLAGEAQIAHAGHSFDLLPGQYMIIDPRSRFDCFLSPEHYHLAFGIPCWQMNQTVERSTGAACIHPSFPRERLTISDEDRGFFGLLSYVCREINEPGSALCLPMIARMIEDSLLSMLALRFLGIGFERQFSGSVGGRANAQVHPTGGEIHGCPSY